MLPSEAQWEKAARGNDGGAIRGVKTSRRNTRTTGRLEFDATSAVGIFPKGESPYGVLDASGNVWEWTATKWVDNYENYKPDERLDGDALADAAWRRVESLRPLRALRLPRRYPTG